jgi:ABC-type antimicrobial peptide transport system permease subunit
MRGLGVSFLVRRARSSWLLLACVTVTVLFTTGFAAVLWAFATQTVPAGALSGLTDPQGRMVAINELADTGKAASDAQVIRSTLDKAWPGIGYQMDSALWAAPVQLPSLGTPQAVTSCPTNSGSAGTFISGGLCTAPAVTTQVMPASLDGITAQASLTAGQWPGAPHPGDPVPVALPAAAASQLHVRVGSVLTGTTQSGTTVSLQVTGLFVPKDPASTYWELDLLPVAGFSIQGHALTYAGISAAGTVGSYGPAVVNPAAFDGTLTGYQASWTALPQASPMARGNVTALAASTSAALSQLAIAVLPYGLKVTSGLPRTLNGIAATIVLTRSLFTIAALQLLLVAVAGLVLAARLLSSLREEESALLRARGATRWQMARPALAEAAVLGAAAGLVGVLAGSRLVGVLAGLGNLHLEDYSGAGIPPLAWLTALAMLVLCVLVMAWPALYALTPGAARLRRGRQARVAGIARAGGDVALVALAGVAVWQLRGYSAVAHPATGSLGIDPVVAIAPALALAGLAIIPLRGLPLLARLADKATDYERWLAAAMVSWEIARRPIRQAGPALLVVVVTATATLGLTAYQSWRQSAADQAAFAVGSDVRVDSAAGLPLGTAAAITQVPGVTAATAASVTTVGNAVPLIALDASTAAKTILIRSDLSPLPRSALWQRITPARPAGLALPGQPQRLEALLTLGAATNGPATAIQGLHPAMVQAYIQEADGAAYAIPADAPLPFNGQPDRLVFTLSRPGQASYPLRLLGFSFSYFLPSYDQANPSYAPTAAFTVASLAVAPTASAPFDKPFSPGHALASFTGTGASPYVPTGPPRPFGSGLPPSDGQLPAIGSWRGVPGGGQRLTFYVGHQPSLQVELGVNLAPGVATGSITLTAQPPSKIVPAIATSGYLAANHLSIGSTVPLSGSLGSSGGYPAAIQIVAVVKNFPTVLGNNQALIIDLAEFNDVLAANQTPPLPVTRWWLATAGSRVPPRLPTGLGLSVTGRLSQQAALLNDSLLTAPRQAMLAVGLAAVLLGVLGFSISVAASLRARRTQRAVFAALGVGKAAQAAQLCLEQGAISLPAATAGLLVGIGLAQLMVPAITLTTDATQPLPSPLVTVPLGWAVALALVAAALPAAAAALTVLRRPDPAAQLRMEAR